MCKHVNDIYLFHNLGKPNAQYTAQRRKKTRQQQRDNYFLEHRNSTLQASCKVEYWQAGRDGHGSIECPLMILSRDILNPWAEILIIKNKTWQRVAFCFEAIWLNTVLHALLISELICD